MAIKQEVIDELLKDYKKNPEDLLGEDGLFKALKKALIERAMSVREIRDHIEELYGVEVSPDLISRVTDEVMDEVCKWQSRPLDEVYPIIIFDTLRIKIRDEGTVRNKAVYLALGFTMGGYNEVLGLWIEQTEGAKFWLRVE